jgi:hypothetical protein
MVTEMLENRYSEVNDDELKGAAGVAYIGESSASYLHFL